MASLAEKAEAPAQMCPQEPAQAMLPEENCPQELSRAKLPEEKCPQTSQAELSESKCPQAGKCPQNALYNLPSTRLTFFQRHFTKSTQVELDTATESGQRIDSRHFSFTSRGFLALATIMFLSLTAATAAAATLGAQSHHRPEREDPGLVIPHHQLSPIHSAISTNFPDPAIWFDNSTHTWYAYATNNAAGIHHVQNSNASEYTASYGAANVQMATSTDFVNWNVEPLSQQPLPVLGAWSRGVKSRVGRPIISGTWAPGVGRRADGKYVMYYSSPWAGKNPRPEHPTPHCIGAAVSTTNSPAGPYEAEEDALACPTEIGGAIDPEPYSENSTLWVVYKVDGNNVGNGGECKRSVTRNSSSTC